MPKLKDLKRRTHLVGISSKGHAAQGIGLSSRQSEDFVIPTDWTTEERRVHIRYRSPTGLYFASRTAVQEFLACPSDTDAPYGLSMDESGSEYFPTPRKGRRLEAILQELTTSTVEQPENCIFVTELQALTCFLEEVSAQRPCTTEGCLGSLMHVLVDKVGLGGGTRIQLACSGCTANNLTFDTSIYILESRRHVTSLSVALAFLLTGHTHSGYHKTLGRALGIPVLRRRSIFTVLKDAYSHIQGMLQCMCDGAKEPMKTLPAAHLGSWQNAVTTADACWLTRGHFSQNCTFIIKNYLSNTILWYGHVCMRGNDDVIEQPLYPGTSKSAEGFLAEKVFQQARDEGCQVVINWQDGDSSSAKSILSAFPSAQIMHCAGHVGRAHSHQLNDLKAKTSM